jgi:hypothetical protein
MSQAENPHNTNLSRRAALAGLAGVAAALPAPAAGVGNDHPDAELLALAGQFEPLFCEYCALRLASDLDYLEFEALVDRATGIKRDAIPEMNDDPSGYWLARDALANKDHGPGRFDPDRNERVTDQLYPLAGKILSYNASTREGLALQVRAIMATQIVPGGRG